MRYRADPSDRVRLAVPRGTQQILGLVAQLTEVRSSGKVRHDISLREPVVREQEERRSPNNTTTTVEVDSVLPADPEAPSSARPEPSAQTDRRVSWLHRYRPSGGQDSLIPRQASVRGGTPHAPARDEQHERPASGERRFLRGANADELADERADDRADLLFRNAAHLVRIAEPPAAPGRGAW